MKYIVAIKHLGKYYVRKESKNSNLLEFPTYELNGDFLPKDFKSRNVKIKKEIVEELTHNTPFRNTRWTGEVAYKSISLQKFKVKNAKKTRQQVRLVTFSSNVIRKDKKNEFIRYTTEAQKDCNLITQKIVSRLKFQNNWSACLFFGILFLFFLAYFLSTDVLSFNVDAFSLIFGVLGYFVLILKKIVPTDKYLEKYSDHPLLGNATVFNFLLFVSLFLLSLFISVHIRDIWNPLFSKIGFLILIVEAAIEHYQQEI